MTRRSLFIDGARVDSFVTEVGPPYATRTVVFTATGTSTLLAFSNEPPIGGGVGLDNISVTEVPVDDSLLMIPAIAGGAVVAVAAAGVALAIARRRNS